MFNKNLEAYFSIRHFGPLLLTLLKIWIWNLYIYKKIFVINNGPKLEWKYKICGRQSMQFILIVYFCKNEFQFCFQRIIEKKS